MDNEDFDINEIEELEFESSELPIERLLKYITLKNQQASSLLPTEREARQATFRRQAQDAWIQIQQRATAGESYAELIASVDGSDWARELDVARGDFFRNLRELNEARRQTLIHALKEGTFKTLKTLIAKDESEEHGAVNGTLDELDEEFQRLRALPANEVEYNHQLKLLNGYAILEARLALLKLEITCIDRAHKKEPAEVPPPEPAPPKKSSFKKFASNLRPKRKNSLAKAERWEGNDTNRISARKAAMYRLRSL